MKWLASHPLLLVTLLGCATSQDLEETRRQIDLVNQQANSRLSQVETKLSNEKLLDLVSQVEVNKTELAKIRGDLEGLAYQLQATQKRQNDLYNDLDLRLGRFEGRSASEPVTHTRQETSEAQPAEAVASTEYNKAIDLLRARKFGPAALALKRFTEQYPRAPEVPDATYWLGVAHTALRQYDAAIDIHRRFAEQYPAHPKTPDALRNMANCQRDLGQVDSAKETLKRLIRLYPKSSAAAKAKEQLAKM